MRKIATAVALMTLTAASFSACSKPEAQQAVEEVQETTSEIATDAKDAMSSAAADFAVSDPISYTCALGTKLSVVFSDDKADVTVLSDNNRKLTLLKTPSGDGTLYQTEGYSLHTKGNDATWGSADEACTKG